MQILMDTDTGDRHILHITIAPSSVITYYKIANRKKKIPDRQMQIANSKLPIARLPLANCQLQISNCKLTIAKA